jgi:cysteine-rich repeat protein
VLLPPLAGCLIDRGDLVPIDVDAGALDASPGVHDARTTDEDARAPEVDASAPGVDARAPEVDAPSARCGDGALTTTEDCDDGNDAPDDGCSPTCTTEPGFDCAGQPSVCTTTCGDRERGGDEECDDGNLSDGDGCDAGCLFETSRRVTRGPGLALAIPDDAYDGSLGSMACVALDVGPFPLDTVAGLEVELAMRHPWVADLVIKLIGPGGSPIVVTLMSRPSIDEPADDGTRMNGNDANLAVAFPIRFVDGAAVSAEDMGDGIGNRNVCEADGICDFAPDPGAAAAGDLGRFVGGPASGAWRLCVGDAAGADVGAIDSVALVMELQR